MPTRRSVPRVRTRGVARAVAACALGVLAVAGAAQRAQAQGSSSTGAAQYRFNHAREDFLARRYQDALEGFRAANELVPSPNTRLYIARCLRELGHPGAAYVEYQRAAGEAADRASAEPRFAATRDTARTEGAVVEARMGRLIVRVPHPPDGITITLAGSALPSGAWGIPTPLDPGPVEVVATAPGRRAVHRTVDVAAGASGETTIELEAEVAAVPAVPAVPVVPARDPERPPPVLNGDATPEPPRTVMVRREVGGAVRAVGYVVGVLGVGGLVSFGVFGSLAQNRFNDLRMACPTGPCDPALASQIDEGEQYALYANISVGLGAAALVGGIVMIAVGGPTSVSVPAEPAPGDRTARRGPTWSLWGSPRADGRGGLLGVIGAF